MLFLPHDFQKILHEFCEILHEYFSKVVEYFPEVGPYCQNVVGRGRDKGASWSPDSEKFGSSEVPIFSVIIK